MAGCRVAVGPIHTLGRELQRPKLSARGQARRPLLPLFETDRLGAPEFRLGCPGPLWSILDPLGPSWSGRRRRRLCPAEEKRSMQGNRNPSEREKSQAKRELRRRGNKIKALQRAVSAISWRPVSLFPPSLARVAPRSRGQDSILLALWVRQRPPFANSSYPAETPPSPNLSSSTCFLLLPALRSWSFRLSRGVLVLHLH